MTAKMARLHTNEDDIEINDFQILDSVKGASLEVPGVVGLSLRAAFDDLRRIGFSNVREEPDRKDHLQYYDHLSGADGDACSDQFSCCTNASEQL